MTPDHRLRRSVGLLLSAPLALIGAPVAAQETPRMVEEIVVTGSYIRRDNFNLSSPLNVVTNEDIAETGAPNVGETLYNQTFNFGVSRIMNWLGGADLTDSTVTNSNLRGLGAGATLDLMNGRRHLSGNANFTYPQMAIERIETLLDGASALYGSSAIGGVQNFVPYTRFDGLRVMADVRTRHAGGGNEGVFGAMGGFSTDRNSLVFAVETRTRDALKTYDIPKFANVAPALSGAGNPGSFFVPTRDANGNLTGTAPAARDPGCGNEFMNPGDVNSIPGNRRWGVPSGTACQFAFQEFWDYKTELDMNTAYAYVTHEFTPALRLRGELVVNRRIDTTRGSPIDFGLQANAVHNFLSRGVIPGEHPGNPYRAMASDGRLLFAQDAGDGTPARDGNGNVILAADPFDAESGVPFNEDVRIAGWRPLGKHIQGVPSVSNDDNSAPRINRTTFSRYLVGFEFDLGENWIVNADYHYNSVLGLATAVDASPMAIALGLEGKLGPSQNLWFNPFATSQFQCEDRVCGSTLTPEDSAAFNQQFVMDQIAYRSKTNNYLYQHTVDLIASTNNLLQLPAGAMGLAVGAQSLHFSEDTFASARRTGCDSWSLGCDADFEGSRRTDAVFSEIQVPVFDHETFGYLHFDMAGRWTKVEGMDGSFDPKVGLVYQPLEFLSLRASWGTSFIAPSIRQQQAITNFTLETNDPTCTLSGGTCSPAVRAFVLNAIEPNPNLSPETADTYNFGFTALLLGGDLTLQGDWVNIKFDDKIVTTSGPAALQADFVRFQAYMATQCPTADPACQAAAREVWISQATPDLENPAIQRSAGVLSRVSGTYVNLASVETSQVDLSIRYGFDIGNYGRLSLGASATHVVSYEFQNTPTSEKIEARGRVNEGLTHPALPKWRVAPRVNWTMGSHSVTLLGQYHSGAFIRNTADGPLKLSPYSRFNLAYTYDMAGLLGQNSSSQITIGSENVFDQLAMRYNTNGGYNSQLEDPIGRTFYARFVHTF
jgi:iron complex outermembrane recepter protein